MIWEAEENTDLKQQLSELVGHLTLNGEKETASKKYLKPRKTSIT